jgi:hypothetical protein
MALADPPAGGSPVQTGYAPVNGRSMLLDLIPPFLDEPTPESG